MSNSLSLNGMVVSLFGLLIGLMAFSLVCRFLDLARLLMGSVLKGSMQVMCFGG